MKFPRQRKNETPANFSERKRYYYAINGNVIKDIDSYKNFLINKGFDFIEAELQKSNGKTVNIVIPNCIFKVMTKADINKLFNVT